MFSHGWPLSADDWDAQMMFFVLNGFQVVAHDGYAIFCKNSARSSVT